MQNTLWLGSSHNGPAELRIAVVSPFVDKQHGTERVLAELIERLATQHGAAIQLYAQRVADLPTSKITWRKIPAVPGPHLFQFVWWYFANQVARWRDRKFRGLVPDLLYSPGINAPDADAITAHIVFHAFYDQMRPELRLANNALIHWPRIIHRILYYRLIMALERRIYVRSDIALSAVSRLVAEQLRRYFGRDDVFVIRNAVDANQFNARARLARRDIVRSSYGIASGEFVYLLIGNDWKKKGLDTLLEALAECSDLPVHLLVVGKDDRNPHVRRCEELQLGSRVRFLDPSADVLQFYAAADAYVGPSLEDAYGLPTLEAMACGLPVITSTSAGVSEIISDGENGLLLQNPRDVSALSLLLRRLCELPELVRSLGSAAERAAAKESWDAHATRMYEHFLQIISRKSNSSRS